MAPIEWRKILRQNFTKWDVLADYLELNDQQREQIFKQPRFALNLPMRLASKIAKGTLDDPILKQFLPTQDERSHATLFVEDPVGDQVCRKSDKLLHKYKGRVLLVTTSACAMHCRYCFRQHFDYAAGNQLFDDEVKLIEADPSIHEVILSGGDPLSLSDSVLDSLLTRLAAIPHLLRIRFHTRFPIGIPERITDGFLEILQKIPHQIWFVVHINHPHELDEEVLTALKALQKQRVVVLNQSVLLRGVNDDVEVQADLCEKLVNHGILPYYLHQLDRVQGAGHFEVTEAKGSQIIEELAARLPGYAVPKYVKEIAGEPNKTPLGF